MLEQLSKLEVLRCCNRLTQFWAWKIAAKLVLAATRETGGGVPSMITHRHVSETELIIIQKYILREWFWTFAAVLLILLIIMIGVALGDILNDIAGGRVPAGLIGMLLLLKIPDVLSTIVPLSLFMAVIWGLGRIYRDQEMAVMRASGFSWVLLLKPLLNLVLPIAAVLLLIDLFVSPAAASTLQQRLEHAFRNASEWGLQAGQFHILQRGDLVIYVESVEDDGRTLRHVFIQHRDDRTEQIWIAEKGYYWLDEENGARYLTLENGQITEGVRRQLDFRVIRFDRNDLRLPEIEERIRPETIEARPTREILFTGEPDASAEIQWRVSPAIAIVVLGFLAIPLAHSSPREARGGRVVLGILAYAVYANGLVMARSMVEERVLSPLIGLWWVHLLLFVVALIWLQRQGRVIGKA
jgi:lipopolysaccharide export system permease protein